MATRGQHLSPSDTPSFTVRQEALQPFDIVIPYSELNGLNARIRQLKQQCQQIETVLTKRNSRMTSCSSNQSQPYSSSVQSNLNSSPEPQLFSLESDPLSNYESVLKSLNGYCNKIQSLQTQNQSLKLRMQKAIQKRAQSLKLNQQLKQ